MEHSLIDDGKGEEEGEEREMEEEKTEEGEHHPTSGKDDPMMDRQNDGAETEKKSESRFAPIMGHFKITMEVLKRMNSATKDLRTVMAKVSPDKNTLSVLHYRNNRTGILLSSCMGSVVLSVC